MSGRTSSAVERAINMVALGVSKAAAAKACGVARSSVQRAMRQLTTNQPRR